MTLPGRIGNLGWLDPDGVHHVVHYSGRGAWVTSCGVTVGPTRALISPPMEDSACKACVVAEKQGVP